MSSHFYMAHVISPDGGASNRRLLAHGQSDYTLKLSVAASRRTALSLARTLGQQGLDTRAQYAYYADMRVV